MSRLEEIYWEFKELVDEAEELVEEELPGHYDMAKRYWLACIRKALDDDHEFMGNSCRPNMKQTLDLLEDA